MRIILALALSLLLAVPAFAAGPCVVHEKAGPRLARLQEAMAAGRFVAYTPTSLKIVWGEVTSADAASIREDLKALRPYFDGLITYSSRDGAELVPAIAAELGYKAVIVGLWTPSDPDEVRNAIGAARRYPDLVLGFSLGNEIILGKRGTWAELGRYVDLMRARVPDVPLTVSEPFAQFLDGDAAPVRDELDFMLVNIHPVFEKWFGTAGPDNWSDFVVKVTDRLAGTYCGPIIVKETGLPTGPAGEGFTPEKQAAFWRALEGRFPPSHARAFSYFSAFDAPWRTQDIHPVPGEHPEEAFWGLFTETRAPKPVIEGLKKLPAR